MSQLLTQYLSRLNSADPQQGIWVNPDNVDDFIVRRICEQSDDRVLIGTLYSLSFGFQSTLEAIENLLEDGVYSYKNKKVLVSSVGIIEAYAENRLDDDFREALEEDAAYICNIWSMEAAELFVSDSLPVILLAQGDE